MERRNGGSCETNERISSESTRKNGRKLKVVKRKSGNKRRRHLCCWNN
jgi:hypothetical protein